MRFIILCAIGLSFLVCLINFSTTVTKRDLPNDKTNNLKHEYYNLAPTITEYTFYISDQAAYSIQAILLWAIACILIYI